ncbi:MAG: PhnD/SsuA/transferrin family substrate-binding protein, partial [bacterium]
MKKILWLLMIAAITGLTACCDAGANPTEIRIGYVESGTATDVAVKIYALNGLLAAELPKKTIILTSFADDDAIGAALVAGEIHVGVLSARGYAALTTEHPGIAEAVITAVSQALEIQLLSTAERLAAINAIGYDAAMSDSGFVADRPALLIVRTLTYTDNGGDRIASVADLAGQTVCVQSQTSAAGYIYPAAMLDTAGLAFVTASDPNPLAGEVRAVRIGAGFPGAITGLMTGGCDAAFIYLDARDNAALLATYPDLFADTRAVALTTGIREDTIALSLTLSDELRAAIRDAFLAVATLEAGIEAIDAFGHAGYQLAVDSDYGGERVVYLFLK